MNLDEIKRRLLELEGIEETEAVGIFGSLVRGDFGPRSDIDVFVVLKSKPSGLKADDLWWKRVYEVLKEFGRDITVLVYSLKGLKEVFSWYILRLASEGVIIYDRGGVEEIFQRIITVAKEAGLVEDEIHGHRFWIKKDLRLGQTFEVRVE